MAGIFKAKDIILAAEEIETRGEAFYKHLVSITEDEATRELFAWLAGEEAIHRGRFHAMGERLGTIEVPAGGDMDDFVAYMHTLLNNHALFSTLETMPTEMGKAQAIAAAMSFEKDTMLFFMEMKQFIPASETKHLDACIDEERSHLKKLASMLK